MKIKTKVKVRKGWGDLKPVTKIKDNGKRYNRKKLTRRANWMDLE
jgi:hypothetical protein